MSFSEINIQADRNISMDVSGITNITTSSPMGLADGTWFVEMQIQTHDGTLSLHLLSKNVDSLNSLNSCQKIT